MIPDVLLHLALEGVGSLALFIAWRWCRYRQHDSILFHQVTVWLVIAVPMSYLTVRLIG